MTYYIVFIDSKEFKHQEFMHPGFQILQHSTAHKLLAEPISEWKTTTHTCPTVYIFQAQNGSFQFHFHKGVYINIS